jgi:hypothetical protein
MFALADILITRIVPEPTKEKLFEIFDAKSPRKG